MTRQDFGKFIGVVRGVYRDDSFLASTEAAEVWYGLLRDLSYDQVKTALMKHAMTSKWTPTIAELREQVVDIQTDGADWSDGWKEVLTAIRRFGYANEAGAMESMSPMTREVVKRLGWMQICGSETDELMAIRANFRMIYEQKQNKAKVEAQLPIGFMEKAKSLTERGVDLLE